MKAGEGVIRRKDKLPGGEMVLTHTPYRSVLRVLLDGVPSPQQFVKEYGYWDAAKAQQDYDTLLRALGEKGKAA